MRNRFLWMFIGGCLLALTIGGQLFLSRGSVANAQTADTPMLNSSSGDFNTAIIQGNRGFYGSTHWVVAPQLDTSTLNCRRTPGGSIRSRIAQGAIITSRFTGPVQLDNGQRPNKAADAIVSYQGKPWLRITGTEPNVIFPPNGRDSDYQGECYVRANLKYIVPISDDAQLSSPAAPAANLIKQELEGTFTLSDASPLLTGTLPSNSGYSGFVVYEENGTLSDWSLNVDGLGLNLVPGSDPSGLGTPTVSFDLLSPSSWDLSVDFGIAFDAPRYDITRADSTITLNGALGVTGGYTYQDRHSSKTTDFGSHS